jgi:transglutaminase-like putative cysteine protease
MRRQGRQDTTLDSSTGWSAGIHERLRFDTTATGSTPSPSRPARHGHGVCQDFTHIFIATRGDSASPPATSRAICSGATASRSRKRRTPGSRPGSRISAGSRSIALNGICTDDAYIRVACGLDYRDAAPVAGARSGGGAEQLTVEVKVSEAAAQAQAQSQS